MIAVASVLAGAIASVSGFGIGSLLTPLLVLLIPLPAGQAVAVLAIPHALATALRFARLRHDVDRPTFREFGIASAIGGLTGAALQSQLTSPVLTVALSALLLLAGSMELARRHVPLPQTSGWRLTGGVLSGLFGGLVGNQGGIRSAALLGFQLKPRQLVATATASALLVDVARVPIYFLSSGGVIANSVSLLLVISAGVTVGTFLGVPILGRIPESAYRRLVGVLLIVLAVSLIVLSFRQ